MSLKHYGILKGRPIGRRLGVAQNAHYQVHIVDETTDYRIAINVKSALEPSELEYLIDEDYQHPLTERITGLPLGFTKIPSKPGGMAVDFIRNNMFDPAAMRPLPFNLPGLDDDLNEKLDKHIQLAMADEEALVYAFGERWGPEKNKKDKIFGFLPGNGIHDIHMNQSNVGQFVRDDGVWQDGAVLIHFPRQNQWVGIFLKFQSQGWHTDDITGHKITAPALPIPSLPATDGVIRIVAAMVNPVGPAPELETVTLVNASPAAINLMGWQIADRMKHKHPLQGEIASGASLLVKLAAPVQLGNDGGIITVLDKNGLKVDGVSYTKEQARREGWTIVF